MIVKRKVRNGNGGYIKVRCEGNHAYGRKKNGKKNRHRIICLTKRYQRKKRPREQSYGWGVNVVASSKKLFMSLTHSSGAKIF